MLLRNILSPQSVNNNGSQRLHAADQMWLVGFVEGDGSFSVNKNGNYVKFEFCIELSSKDKALLFELNKILGGGGSITSRTRKTPRLSSPPDRIA